METQGGASEGMRPALALHDAGLSKEEEAKSNSSDETKRMESFKSEPQSENIATTSAAVIAAAAKAQGVAAGVDADTLSLSKEASAAVTTALPALGPAAVTPAAMVLADEEGDEDSEEEEAAPSKRGGRTRVAVSGTSTTEQEGSSPEARPIPTNSSKGKKNVRVSCHQCKTTKDDEGLLFCTTKAEKGKRKRRCRKKYCDACLRRSYNMSIAGLTPAEVASYCCPACTGTCSCAACQRKQMEGAIRKTGGGAAASGGGARGSSVASTVAATASVSNNFNFNPLFNMNTFLNSIAAVPAVGGGSGTSSTEQQQLASLQALAANSYLPFLQQSTPTAAAVAAANAAASSPAAAAAIIAAGVASPADSSIPGVAVPLDSMQASLMAQLQLAQQQQQQQAGGGGGGMFSASALAQANLSPTTASPNSCTQQLSRSLAQQATASGSSPMIVGGESMLSPGSGGKSADLTSLSSQSLAQQQAAAAAAAAITQAEIEEKTRQLQDLLARRMSQDPHFLANFNMATGGAGGGGTEGTGTGGTVMGTLVEGTGVTAQEVIGQDDLRSNSPTAQLKQQLQQQQHQPVVWDDALFQQHQREQQRAQLKLEKTQAQRAHIAPRQSMTGPMKSRTLARTALALAAAAAAGLPVPGHTRGHSGSQSGGGPEADTAIAVGGGKAPRDPSAPGRIYKRRASATSSPYSRPAEGPGSRRMSLSPQQQHPHVSATGAQPYSAHLTSPSSLASASLELEDEDMLEDDSSQTTPPRSQKSLTMSPSDPNYHRFLQQRSQQQQQQQQQQQLQSQQQQFQPQQQQQQQQSSPQEQSSYNQRLLQAHRILVERSHTQQEQLLKGAGGRGMPLHPGGSQQQQLQQQIQQQQQQHYSPPPQHPHSASTPATRPLNMSRHEDLHALASVDVLKANQHYQYPSSGHGSGLFSPNMSNGMHSGGGGGLLSPNPLPLSIGIGLNTPLAPPDDYAISNVSYTPLAMQTPQASSGGGSAQAPSSLPPPLMSSSASPTATSAHSNSTSAHASNSSSFLFTPGPPPGAQTPSIFINHGGLNSVAAGGNGNADGNAAPQYDWSQAHPATTAAVAAAAAAAAAASSSTTPPGASGGQGASSRLSKIQLLNATSSPLCGYSGGGHINGASILGMLSPTTSHRADMMDGGAHKYTYPPVLQPISPMVDGLPQLPTA